MISIEKSFTFKLFGWTVKIFKDVSPVMKSTPVELDEIPKEDFDTVK